jgi:WD40 repeat protein
VGSAQFQSLFLILFVSLFFLKKKVPYLLASGDEDGHFRVWDLRNFKVGQPVADFAWHAEAITSIEWCVRVGVGGRVGGWVGVYITS